MFLTTVLAGRYYYYFHFVDENTKAYLGKVIHLVLMAKLGVEHRSSKLHDISS